MVDLPWSINLVQWFVEHRVEWLTQVFLFFTFLGGEMGYILMVLAIFWLYDKRLAVQLVFVIIATTLLNHVLKIIIRKPRPFVESGTYQEKWAIAEGNIEETVHSFSTPSGHAQGSSTFWWYLHLKEKSRLTFILLPIMVIGIGLSRPYLGVHFVEDVVLGWIIGFILVIFLHKYDGRVESWWNSLSKLSKITIGSVAPLAVVLLGGFFTNFGVDGTTFATLGGISSGIILGGMLEQSYINYDPDLTYFGSTVATIVIGVIRFLIGVVLVGLVLIGLDKLFSQFASEHSVGGYLLRWLRYGLVGFFGIFVAPLVFVKLRLASHKVYN